MLSRLPWTPAPEAKPLPKPRRRMNRDRRRHLVEKVATYMKAARDNGTVPTLLNFEASIRHGLRSGLCLEGWGWADADAVAADIVSTALKQIGAQRPIWQEGQPDYAQHGTLIMRENCLNCGRPLLGDFGTKFCGVPCKNAWQASMAKTWLRKDGDAYQTAVRRARGINEQHV